MRRQAGEERAVSREGQIGTNWAPLSAAVLAGGRSERMGEDKAFLRLWPGGPTLLEIALQRLRAVADDVVIVANDVTRHEGFGAPVTPDVMPGLGTLSGIHAALTAARHEHCLIVACDMPLLDSRVLALLAAQPRDYDVLIPQTPGTSRQGNSGQVYQTLHAIYSRRCLAPITAQLAAGNPQVVAFFSQVDVRVLDRAAVLALDPEERSFMNTNTPQALEDARRICRLGNP